MLKVAEMNSTKRRISSSFDPSMGRGSRRNGSAAVELAICLPVILLVVSGAIEGANFAFLRQTLAQSAYEGVKVTVRRGSNPEDGLAAARRVTEARQVRDATFQFVPADPRQAAPGTPVTLIVSAPGDSNSLMPVGPFSGRTITIRATMARE